MDEVRIYENAYIVGFRQAMFTGAGLAVLGGMVAFITIRNNEKTDAEPIADKQDLQL